LMSSAAKKDNKKGNNNQNNEDGLEIIGRWKISKLIRKGRNTWIHEGIDIINNKIVALKFISKADKTWVKQQAKQIETEIQALQKLKHKHIIRLYAYNLDAKYPTKYVKRRKKKNGSSSSSSSKNEHIQCVLLVLEYASCGELFNLLYYTSGLNENISRTYFKQIISAIHLCHNKGIIHRDLRPKNLLLNSNYNIKITNFNTAKMIKSDSDFLMKTKFIGSRSYQSPELLKNKSLYDFKCDIFSVGVILFILLAGYPPFEEASEKDRWYKYIIQKNFTKFWRCHQNSAIPEGVKKLLEGMLCYDVSERLSIAQIMKNSWYNGTTLGKFTLQMAIQDRYALTERMRRQAMRTNGAEYEPTQRPMPFQQSNGSCTIKCDNCPMILYPYNDRQECLNGEVYTFGWNNTKPIYQLISLIIKHEYNGQCEYILDDNKLYCTIQMVNPFISSQTEKATIDFTIGIYKSKLWLDKYKESDGDIEDIEANKEDIIYIVCIERKNGDELLWTKIKNETLLKDCSDVFRGLPQWARRMKLNIIYSKQLLTIGFIKERYDFENITESNIIDIVCKYINNYGDDNDNNDEEDDEQYQNELDNFKW